MLFINDVTGPSIHVAIIIIMRVQLGDTFFSADNRRYQSSDDAATEMSEQTRTNFRNANSDIAGKKITRALICLGLSEKITGTIVVTTANDSRKVDGRKRQICFRFFSEIMH